MRVWPSSSRPLAAVACRVPPASLSMVRAGSSASSPSPFTSSSATTADRTPFASAVNVMPWLTVGWAVVLVMGYLGWDALSKGLKQLF